ncbi:unnamed protein product [Pleuronectes platessa]|uniref:Uncharacterized protein n=1 Tax=Pleuronectes platessa TaxID=8262 RepID=A0A9N7VMP2_PLEPL|nr:unnamed protein product [Pleuronectes platessa]
MSSCLRKTSLQEGRTCSELKAVNRLQKKEKNKEPSSSNNFLTIIFKSVILTFGYNSDAPTIILTSGRLKHAFDKQRTKFNVGSGARLLVRQRLAEVTGSRPLRA